MKALFLSILALLPAAASAQRDTLGVLERSSVFSAEDERAVAGFHTESPAMMLYRSEQSLSQISLRSDLRREQEALLQPLGDGAFDGGFYAESYRRLSERSATWADARYVRGNRRNVCWNSTADYLLLYPCITADSAGGNLSTEEYAFGGGYTTNAALTLYPVWQTDTYTITYDLDRGTADDNPTGYTVETETFTLKNPTRPGYIFSGWSGTGLTGENNLTVTIEKGSTGNRSYTAP